MIQYELVGRTYVTLSVYDAIGRRVRTLHSGEMSAGRYEVVWDGQNEGGSPVASGTYIARLESKIDSDSRRVMLIK